jgi:hypothetical protein
LLSRREIFLGYDPPPQQLTRGERDFGRLEPIEKTVPWRQWSAVRANFFILSAASRDSLNPLAPPGGGLEGIREILRLLHDLTVRELHDAHCVVGNCVFGDPEITFSENSS